MDQDLWFKALLFHGHLLLKTIIGEESTLKGQVESDKLSICQFIKHQYSLLFKSKKTFTDDTLPDCNTPIIPIELFQDSSAVDRRDLFFKTLDRGVILILRVINDTLQDNFKLLVLCREGNFMKLDDLSLVMYLPKLPAEIALAGGELHSTDLIRAAVCSCSIDERKLYVTLDSNILDDDTEEKVVHLGKISESDLPFYFGEIDFGPSYVDYLHRKQDFINGFWSEELYSFLDLQKNYLYSFRDNMDGKTYEAREYAPELKRRQDLNASNVQHNKALAYYDVGNFSDAFLYFNKALSIYPQNTEALVSRGILHSNTNNLRKAFIDMEAALTNDKHHKRARQQMSILLVSAARKHIEENDLEKAQESLEAALNLDGDNKDAIAALDEINNMDSASGKSDGSSKLDKKTRINSNSSDRSDSSSSRKDSLKDQQELFLKSTTRALLASLKKKHHSKSKKKNRHHSHKSRSKSPKRKSNKLDPPDKSDNCL